MGRTWIHRRDIIMDRAQNHQHQMAWWRRRTQKTQRALGLPWIKKWGATADFETNFCARTRWVWLLCLQQLHSERVLVWAKRYLARRWSFFEQLDELICSYDNNWRRFIIEELSERPIDSMMAFSDTIIPILIQRLDFDGFWSAVNFLWVQSPT